MRAIIYMRVATRTSPGVLDRQEAQCREFAASRGYQVTGVYADEGVSAFRPDRPGLDAAMNLARAGGCDVLIASTASVLTRSASQFRSITSDADASGVAVVTADGVNTSDGGGRLAAWFTGGPGEAAEAARDASAEQ